MNAESYSRSGRSLLSLRNIFSFATLAVLLVCAALSAKLFLDLDLKVRPLVALVCIIFGIWSGDLPGKVRVALSKSKKRGSKSLRTTDFRTLTQAVFSLDSLSTVLSVLTEEPAFCGTILTLLTRSMPVVPAVLVSAVLFVVEHLILQIPEEAAKYKFSKRLYATEFVYAVIGIFWLRVVLTTAFLVTGTIWVSCLIHLVNNLFCIVDSQRFIGIAVVVGPKYARECPGDVDPEARASIALDRKGAVYWLIQTGEDEDQFTWGLTTDPREASEIPFKRAWKLATVIRETIIQRGLAYSSVPISIE